MSLIKSALEDVVMLDKKRISDGQGGFLPTKWEEGAVFQAAISFDTSMTARLAEVQGVTNLYTVTTSKNVLLDFHDVFKRLSDGKVFRVTSDGDDKVTPKSSTLSFRQVTAEEWRLPT